LILAAVIPRGAAARMHANGGAGGAARDSDAILADLRATVPGAGRVETLTVRAPSPALALRDLAERRGAAVVVVGPTRGRFPPGSTAGGLAGLAGSPVAVVPPGVEIAADRPFAAIGAADGGSDAAQHAVSAAAAVADASGAQLRVIGVCDGERRRILRGSDYVMSLRDLEALTARRLDAVTAALPASVRAHPVLAQGDPVAALVKASSELDLLFVGSRGRGPTCRPLLGRVVRTVMRAAGCPVVVVPEAVVASRRTTPAFS
jgi:nucleotide-binding universal stress UspA family protein